MNDRAFLIWLHARLANVHGESELFDYMHKLRAIIAATPADRLTPNVGMANSLEQLMEQLNQSHERR